jgi:HEPN domain-containing protein
MQPDPERVAEAREWLRKPDRDLRAAGRLLEPPEPLPDVAQYHCQQAAEKALKAFLFWNDVPFQKTHVLETLGAQCVGVDATLAPIVERISVLTPLAWLFRYSGDAGDATTEEGRESLMLAREAYREMSLHLPPAVSGPASGAGHGATPRRSPGHAGGTG